jgi:membrane associated rhomboid family serine protease
MLEDRDYMRQESYAPRITFTVAIIIVNAVIFLVESISLHTSHAGDVAHVAGTYLALSLDGLRSGYVWQLLTFQFLHAGWLHLIFNSLAIFFVGRTVETLLGGRTFLTLYFTSGIIGGLFQVLYALVLRQWDSSVVGASAGAAGLIGAFALLAWNEEFTAILYFVPVTMRGKTLFIFSVAVSVALMVVPGLAATLGLGGIANAAHLGGILAGFFYVRQIVQGRWHLPEWKLPSRTAAPRELAAKSVGQKSSWKFNAIPPAEDLTKDEFLQKEVDPILDKISARGIQSLTSREREILEKARSRMNKR